MYLAVYRVLIQQTRTITKMRGRSSHAGLMAVRIFYESRESIPSGGDSVHDLPENGMLLA